MKRIEKPCKKCGKPCLGRTGICLECLIEIQNKQNELRFDKDGEYEEKLDEPTGEQWL